MRIFFTLTCLLPAMVQGAVTSEPATTTVPAFVDDDLPVFVDDDLPEMVEPAESSTTAEQTTATASGSESITTPQSPAVVPTATAVAVEGGSAQPTAEPSVTVSTIEVPTVAPREMTPAEQAALDAQKPAPSPDVMEPPSGMALIETYLPASYANLAKRTPQGDWVTCHFKQPLVPREQTQVAVLGYHDFSNTKSTTEMRMKTAEFCRQMQFLKDSDICVISMQDFLEWRFGTRCLPERCVLITIDDGWKSVYTDAYPVLKAYGYPFTLFVYVRYVGVKGASMTQEQLKEMMAHGATIGSHSWNHLYPSKWKRYKKTSVEYATQLKKEFIDSRAKLQEWFGNCSTYCYPGGYHTAPMRSTLKIAAYQAAFTVIEKKVKCDVKPYQVNRYMVFGVDTSIFRRAVNFDGQEGVDSTITAINNAEAPARLFCPTAFTGVDSPLKQTEKTAVEKAAAKAAQAATTTTTPTAEQPPATTPDGADADAPAAEESASTQPATEAATTTDSLPIETPTAGDDKTPVSAVTPPAPQVAEKKTQKRKTRTKEKS